MATPQPVPQTNVPQEQRRRVAFPHWVRPVVITLMLVFFAVCAVVWISNIWGHISDVMSALFAILGVMCAFLALPFLYESRDTQPLSSTSTPVNPVVINIQNQFPAVLSTEKPETTSAPSSSQGATTAVAAPSSEQVPTTPPTSAVPVPVVPTTPPVQVSLPVHDEHIFLFNERLTNEKDFFGRASERKNLVDRTKTGNSTSLIGPRRIGKTWLMTYVKLVAPVQLEPAYRVGYFDASLPMCSTVAGFTFKALEALDYPILGTIANLKLETLEVAVKDLVAKKQTPVLCIDEFERLSDGQEFDLPFFAGLRAITQIGMSMITASQKPLIEMVSEHVKTSPFFNVFEQVSLRHFDIHSAKKFVEEKGGLAGFTVEEKGYLLEYGKVSEQEWPPLRLQLVGKMLLADKLNAQEDPESYRPTQQSYWRDFEKRLNSTYQAAVGS